jgi:catechol 2,3-dioxygenase-like lactoylglutathione lyase family enzyme
MRLEQAMLFVVDMQGMTAFYRDVMGLRPVEETRLDDWVEFDAGGASLALHAVPSQIAEQIRVSSPSIPHETAPCKLVFAVDDSDTEMARLAQAGVTILHRTWGGWDAVDPEGNVLGFRQRNK